MVSLTDWYYATAGRRPPPEAPRRFQQTERGHWQERRLGPSRVERTWVEAVRPRTRPVATARPRKPSSSPPDEVPELRAGATPTFTVRLGHGALQGILAELERSEGLLHTVETGGNVFGRRTGTTIELIHASGPGNDGKARRLPDAVMVSLADGYRHAKELKRIYQDDGLSFLGGWHTHPIREPLPSATDRSEGLAGLDQMHRLGTWTKCWLDLILMPSTRRGWEAPSVRGWATRRTEFGAVTEPVRVVE